MTLIAWKQEFRTGIASLDHEHEEMIHLLNDLYTALVRDGSRDSIVAFLGEVHARISAHFALEERIMRDRDYQGYPDHKTDHERLLDQIRDLMDGYEDQPSGDEAFRAQFGQRLQAWFTDHFREQDAKLHHVLGI
ncbi:MAG: bacteriohemerythrin [Alphaproteobacteria bacterium]|nr:bacteriohemerythrin [Alphaproteobacteria bacterium]